MNPLCLVMLKNIFQEMLLLFHIFFMGLLSVMAPTKKENIFQYFDI